MCYHSDHKEFYNSTNPYMENIELFEAIDRNDSSITAFMDPSIATYDNYGNTAAGLQMIGSMDDTGNIYESLSSYY